MAAPGWGGGSWATFPGVMLTKAEDLKDQDSAEEDWASVQNLRRVFIADGYDAGGGTQFCRIAAPSEAETQPGWILTDKRPSLGRWPGSLLLAIVVVAFLIASVAYYAALWWLVDHLWSHIDVWLGWA